MLVAYINVISKNYILYWMYFYISKSKLRIVIWAIVGKCAKQKIIHVFMTHAYFYNVLFVGVYWKRNRNVKKYCNLRHLSNMSLPNKKKNEWELSIDLMSDIQYHCAVILDSQWK